MVSDVMTKMKKKIDRKYHKKHLLSKRVIKSGSIIFDAYQYLYLKSLKILPFKITLSLFIKKLGQIS